MAQGEQKNKGTMTNQSTTENGFSATESNAP